MNTITKDASVIAEENRIESKEKLDKEPKVSFLIPLGDQEKPGAYDTACINGNQITVQKGVMVEIPKSFALLFADKYRIQMEAGKDSRLDRRSDVQDALN
jgi:Fe-S cluster assembly scaffold protein SufB